jgi:endonuclease-3
MSGPTRGDCGRPYAVAVPRVRSFDSETPLARTRRARRVVRELHQVYPDVRCELDFSTPFQLLVATVLSAQTTDKRVNAVTPLLFSRYPDAAALAAAEPAEVETIVASTGFFRTKTRAIVGIAQALCERFGGEVPGRLDDLVTLPGVGRKTANVVLGNAFGVPGITVDTHVARLSRRFGFTREADADRIEADLARLLPPSMWTDGSQLLIWHGRRCCHARTPACGACAVAPLCPGYGTGPTDPVEAAALLRTEGRS